MKILQVVSLVLISSFVLTGCTLRKIGWDNELFPPEPVIAVGPGDVLDIKIQNNPEYNIIQTVRPDGKISAVAVDEIQVAGLTPDEIDKRLTEAYSVEFNSPNVTVVVTSYHRQKVYVDGQVRSPGIILMPDKLTPLEAIAQAGGFNMTSASRKKVIVLRQKGDQLHAKLINLEKVLKRELSDQFYLGPNDIVYVPRTDVFKLNQTIRQYLSNNVPFVNVISSATIP